MEGKTRSEQFYRGDTQGKKVNKCCRVIGLGSNWETLGAEQVWEMGGKGVSNSLQQERTRKV